MMKKGIRGILLAAGILTLAGGEWTISEARADAGIRQEETGQTPADSEEEIPQVPAGVDFWRHVLFAAAWTTRTCTPEWRKRIRMDMCRLWKKIRLP